LAGELRRRLSTKNATMPEAIKQLKIKISGCFNSCGQHHVADSGFFGNNRRAGNYKVPHFQVVLGGQWTENAGSYGLAIGAVPAKNSPDLLDTLTNRYVQEREKNESFQQWVQRLGRKEMKAIIDPFVTIPDYEENPLFYRDWGDSRTYTIDDIGVGECAGEVVSLFSIEIARADSEHYDALVARDEGDYQLADQRAYNSMLLAARALIRTQYPNVSTQPDDIVREFRTRFYDTKLFFDKYTGGKFAQYFFNRHENSPTRLDKQTAHRIVEEAQLFIEATHTAEQRVNGVIVS